jgi:iron-sulfur cluster repair protein YtfE (RIC family)
MLRDKNLIPLSHQHQHALALCVRIQRASPIAEADLDAWQKEIAQLFASEIDVHFAAEEQILFPAACGFSELNPLVQELVSDHAALRQLFAQISADKISSQNVAMLAQRLSDHVRKEERQLFEALQKLMSPDDLTRVGHELEEALKKADQSCILPTATTRLKQAK